MQMSDNNEALSAQLAASIAWGSPGKGSRFTEIGREYRKTAGGRRECGLIPESQWFCRSPGDALLAPWEKSPQEDSRRQAAVAQKSTSGHAAPGDL